MFARNPNPNCAPQSKYRRGDKKPATARIHCKKFGATENDDAQTFFNGALAFDKKINNSNVVNSITVAVNPSNLTAPTRVNERYENTYVNKARMGLDVQLYKPIGATTSDSQPLVNATLKEKLTETEVGKRVREFEPFYNVNYVPSRNNYSYITPLLRYSHNRPETEKIDPQAVIREMEKENLIAGAYTFDQMNASGNLDSTHEPEYVDHNRSGGQEFVREDSQIEEVSPEDEEESLSKSQQQESNELYQHIINDLKSEARASEEKVTAGQGKGFDMSQKTVKFGTKGIEAANKPRIHEVERIGAGKVTKGSKRVRTEKQQAFDDARTLRPHRGHKLPTDKNAYKFSPKHEQQQDQSVTQDPSSSISPTRDQKSPENGQNVIKIPSVQNNGEYYNDESVAANASVEAVRQEHKMKSSELEEEKQLGGGENRYFTEGFREKERELEVAQKDKKDRWYQNVKEMEEVIDDGSVGAGADSLAYSSDFKNSQIKNGFATVQENEGESGASSGYLPEKAMQSIEELEKLLKRQHEDLVERGYLPQEEQGDESVDHRGDDVLEELSKEVASIQKSLKDYS